MNRLTPNDIDKVIDEEHYDVIDTLTVCVLKLKNGFMVVGQSACVSIEIFDKVKGESMARECAYNKIWDLEGYLLKQKLYEESLEND